MSDTKKVPKFWFEIDGQKHGARFATIGEQAAVMADVERATNGNFDRWVKGENEDLRAAAYLIQIAEYLNRVVVAWPANVEPINFTESDDAAVAMRYWEAYSKASEDFRKAKQTSGDSTAGGAEQPASQVVSG